MSTKVHLVKAMVFPVVTYGCESWTVKKAERGRIDAFELWCWRGLLKGPWTARRSNQSILEEISPEYPLEDWCWSWNSSTLATWCKELTHWKRPWCWERLKAGGEGDDRGWDGWMALPTPWTWVWVNSRSWWRTGRPGVLQSMGSQSDTTERLNCLILTCHQAGSWNALWFSSRWCYSSTWWLLPCPHCVACLSVLCVYRSLLSQLHCEAHTWRCHRLGWDVGLTLAHGSSREMHRWYSEGFVAALPAECHQQESLPFSAPFPTSSHERPTSGPWVLLERTGFVPHNWNSWLLTPNSPSPWGEGATTDYISLAQCFLGGGTLGKLLLPPPLLWPNCVWSAVFCFCCF